MAGVNDATGDGQQFITFTAAGNTLRMDTTTGETWYLRWNDSTGEPSWTYVPEPKSEFERPMPQRANTAFHDAVDKQFGA